MSHPLSDQRSHSDLIAELYDRHAAGLFAYCFDQLGDKGSAADAVIAVLTSVPVVQPRRSLLYALARREISRRDVVYFPPVVDFAVDPATALIERVVRDIRPHQREVLLLAAVCRLTPDELADVLDVAIDTAGQLIVSARNRFTQSLKTALYHARHAAYVPERVAEVYGALEVAPIEDVLARLPWQRPPGDLRARLLAILPALDSAGTTQPKTRLPVKQLWPTTPDWPLPLTDPDQTTTTSLIPVVPPDSAPPSAGLPPAPVLPPTADPDVARSRRDRKSKHEATTEPIPRLQGSILAAMAEAKAFRPWSRKQQTPPAPPAEQAPEQPDAPEQAGKQADRRGKPGREGRPERGRRAARRDARDTAARRDAHDTADRPDARDTAAQPDVRDTTARPDARDTATRPDIRDTTARPDIRDTATWPDVRDTATRSDIRGAAADAHDDAARRDAHDTAAQEPLLAAFPAPVPGDVLDPPTSPIKPIADEPPAPDARPSEPHGTRTPADARTDAKPADDATAAARSATADAAERDEAERTPASASTADAETGASATAPRARRSRALLGPTAKSRWFSRSSAPRRHGKFKPLKKGEHHFDWAWELVGLLLAIAIALTVFFSIPMIVTP